MVRLFGIVLGFSICLAGCQTGGLVSGQNIGAIGGAALGGLAGNQFGSGTGRALATAGGVVLGGATGSILGQRLDQRDVERAQQAQFNALQQPAGQPISWRSQQTGATGSVVSGASYAINGRECRNFTHTLFVQGQPQQLNGVACRQPDGRWQAVS